MLSSNISQFSMKSINSTLKLFKMYCKELLNKSKLHTSLLNSAIHYKKHNPPQSKPLQRSNVKQSSMVMNMAFWPTPQVHSLTVSMVQRTPQKAVTFRKCFTQDHYTHRLIMITHRYIDITGRAELTTYALASRSNVHKSSIKIFRLLYLL